MTSQHCKAGSRRPGQLRLNLFTTYSSQLCDMHWNMSIRPGQTCSNLFSAYASQFSDVLWSTSIGYGRDSVKCSGEALDLNKLDQILQTPQHWIVFWVLGLRVFCIIGYRISWQQGEYTIILARFHTF